MKPIEYHPESRAESREAIDWYSSRSRAAAVDFADELKAERLHDIQIIAVAHAKGYPGYWAKRL